MKKLLLISIVLSLVCVVKAQTTYSVAAPTLEEKYNMTKILLNNNVLSLITVAKSDGITAEALGKKSGKIFAAVWDENGGFEPYVNFLLYAWACSADNVQIIEQSNEKLVVMISSMYEPVEVEGELFGTTVEDYTTFYNAMLNEIAVHYDKSFEMTWGAEGYRIVISK
jgi:hypothetical protein